MFIKTYLDRILISEIEKFLIRNKNVILSWEYDDFWMCKNRFPSYNKKSLKFVWKVIKGEEMILKIMYCQKDSKRF